MAADSAKQYTVYTCGMTF